MTLLAPALLLGLLGLGLPLAAHLLGRERPRPIAFAAVRFLARVDPAVTHRRGLRDIPLLLVRLLLLALLVVVLARPADSGSRALAVLGEPHDAVILLDASRSMELEQAGQTVFERAIERTEALLDALPDGSRVAFVCSDPGRPTLELSQDRERVRDLLHALADDRVPRPGAWLLGDVVPRASALLTADASDPNRKRIIYAVGDATTRGLGSLPQIAAADTPIITIAASDETALLEHVGLESAAWEAAPELDPRAIRVHAVIRRHHARQDAPPRELTVILSVDKTEVARTSVEVPRDTDIPVEFTHTLLGSGEAVAATVELAGQGNDPLPSDDRRDLWLAVTDTLDVLLINGAPSELRAHDEVFFISNALASTELGTRASIRSLAPDQFERELRERGVRALEETDVLVLANVRAPAEDVAEPILAATREGLGVWITAGDRVDAAAYNARLGELLPLPLRQAVVVGTAPGQNEARSEGMAPADFSHPLFTGIRDELGLAGTRTRKVLLLEPDPERKNQVALAYTSGAPALMTYEFGRGRVALLTTSVDRDWTDLPLRPGFVPLVDGIVTWLGDARGGPSRTRLWVGEPRAFATEVPLSVRTPSGETRSIAPDASGVASFTDTFVPGHYVAERAGGERTRSDVFAVEVDPSESDTQAVTLPENRDVEGTQSVVTRIPRWRGLVLIAALLFALEALLRFRSRRRLTA